MIIDCDKIISESERLRNYFVKCYSLKASDMRQIIDLIESVSICGGGNLEFKTINGESIVGTGDIVIPIADGTETKLSAGDRISISGTGSASNPYVITNTAPIPNGSETKIIAGSNTQINGNGTIGTPYVINVDLPAYTEQVNSDWAAVSGKALILNKPIIPAAQVNSDWNAISGPAMILNKPSLASTDLGYIAAPTQGTVTSSNGNDAILPIVNEINAGLMSPGLLSDLSLSSDNIKKEVTISDPDIHSNAEFAFIINNLPLFEIKGNEIFTFKSIDVIDEFNSFVYYVEMIDIGKGMYGIGGTQLQPYNLRVTSFILSSEDLESEETTQIIDLGISSDNIVDTINSQNPNIVIQEQSAGYVIIKGTFEGVYREYLWIGAGGVYGAELGASTAVDSDLTEITKYSEISKATSTHSGTVKTDLTVADPIVYLSASVDSLLTLRELVSNKQDSLAIDGTGTKFPTVDAVNAALLAGTPDATTVSKGKLKLAGDLGGTADLPTTPTALHKMTNESFTGVKSSTNTGASQINGLSLINNGTSGSSSLLMSNTSTGVAALITNSGSGSTARGIQLNNSGSGIGLFVNNSNGGDGVVITSSGSGRGLNLNGGTTESLIYSNPSVGDGIVSDSSGAGYSGLLFVGKNLGVTTFSVNKLGDTTANKFVKTGGLITQFLKADGSIDSTSYATTLHASTHVLGGSDQIAGEELSVSVIPPTLNYIPVTSTLKGHLQGIDQALGSVTQTTAGISTRIYFTGVTATIGAGTFYTSSATSKGAVASVQQNVTNGDNIKQYFAQDIISVAQVALTTSAAGTYAGQLSVQIDASVAQQRFTIEVYKADNSGAPISSGITGAPIGDLGVTVAAILDSGLINLVAGNLTNITLSGILASQLTLNAGERVRYHISAEKVGTAGGNIIMSVFYGSSHNSFYDVPVTFNTDTVLNKSLVTGITASDALNTLNTNKVNDADVIHKTLNETKAGILTTYGSNITDNTYTFKQYLSPIRNNSSGFYNQPFFASDYGWYIFRPDTVDTPSRFYIMPNGSTSSTPVGITSKFEMFNTDFSQNYTAYTGFNILCENVNNTVSLSPNRGSGGGTRMKMRLLGDMTGSQFFDNASSIDFETNNDIMINRYAGAISFGSNTTDPFSLAIANQFTFKNSAATATRVNIVGNGTSAGLYFGRDAIRTIALESLLTTSDFAISLNATNTGTTLSKYATFFGASGNLLLQNAGTHTDNGYRLDNNGTTRLQSTVTLGTAPTTSAGAYDILTRNTSTGVIEKILSTSIVSGTGTAGQISFWTGTNTQAGDTGLLYDSSTNILTSANNGSYRVTKFVNGTTASPNYEPVATYGFGTAFGTGMYGGNSLTSNNGMFLKFVVNSTTALNTLIDAMILNSSGHVVLPVSDSRIIGGDNAGRLLLTNNSVTSFISLNGSTNAIPNEIQMITTTGNIRMSTNGLERFTILNNGSVGIGASVPVGKLDVNTGTSGLTFNMVNQSIGSIVLSNGAATEAPSLSGKSNSNQYGIRFVAGTIDTNTSTDMLFQVMENDQTDYSAPNLGTSAFRFARFSTTLIDILRNGNTTFTGNVSTIAATTANHAVIKSQLDLKANTASPGLTGVPTAPTASVGTNTTQIATTEFVLANSVGYKSYTASVSQTGTSNPVATTISNNTGLTFTWTRNAIGSYSAVPSVAFTAGKAIVFVSRGVVGAGDLIMRADCGTSCAISQTNGTGSVDGFPSSIFEIRIYP